MTRLLLITYAAILSGGLAVAEPLVSYVVENASSIPEPLTGLAGNADRGAMLFADRGCTACHRAPGHEDAPRVGPDLSGIADERSAGQIRLMIVNPAIRDPEIAMPAYYAIGQAGQVPDELVGRTRLTSEEVEDLVAWLSTLDS
ncbi:MAG: c-type cytochrome [Pseudomonadota bacterium]